MGLDIIAIPEIEFIEYDSKDDLLDRVYDIYGNVYEYEEYQSLFAHPHFPNHWEYDLKENIYVKYDKSQEYSFRAGSYSSYNKWRNDLAKMVRYEEYEDGVYDETVFSATCGPFWELINFSDCEGTISPNYAKKIYNDFLIYNDLAQKQGDQFYDKYTKFKLAFEIAHKKGVVIFG